MKVKVNRLKLIAALQAADKKMAADHKKAVARYKLLINAAREKYVRNVEKYLAELKRGREAEDGYSIRELLNKGLKWPSEPKDKPPSYAHLLSKLQLSEDKVLTVDDHSDYFRFVTRE